MTRKTARSIVAVMLAVIVMMAVCTVVSGAASKKAYKLPGKIKYQDYTDKVTYKGNKITFKSADSGTEKYTCKSNTKYKVKITSPYGSSGSATIKAKKNKVVVVKGKNSMGDKYTTKYYYSKGKLKKSVENYTFADDEMYKKTKSVTKITVDKHGYIKKSFSTITLTKKNGKTETSKTKRIYKNSYKGKNLTKSSYVLYGLEGGKWDELYSDAKTISYKKMKLTKKQYKKYKAIVDYKLGC